MHGHGDPVIGHGESIAGRFFHQVSKRCSARTLRQLYVHGPSLSRPLVTPEKERVAVLRLLYGRQHHIVPSDANEGMVGRQIALMRLYLECPQLTVELVAPPPGEGLLPVAGM